MSAIENPVTAFQAFQKAKGALQRGDKTSARHWAEISARLAPDREEPWLLMAALANPRASIGYLRQALAINPASPRALAGLAWANKRLESANQSAKTAPHRIVKLAPSLEQNAKTAPVKTTAVTQKIRRTTENPRPPLVLLIFPVALVVLIAFAAWNAPAALAFFSSAPAGEAAVNPLPTGLPGTPAAIQMLPAIITPSTLPLLTPVVSTTFQTATPAPPTTEPSLETAQEDKATSTSGSDYQDTTTAGRINAYQGNKRILVSISEQHLYAYEGDNLVFSFIASTGINNATRVGNFAVQSKIPSAYGSTWNIWMPDWLGIYDAGSLENGIHALPILPNGATLWAGYLGTPISYGCVVLDTEDAQLLYNWAEIGVPVIIEW